jgi:SHS2 domain-containing protein
MPYEYLEHVADVGLQATGATLSEAYADAARGLLDLMVDTATVEARKVVELHVAASDPAGLLVAFLNAILAEQDLQRLFFNSVSVERVERTSDGWHISARLAGEPIDLQRHVVLTEVKAATYSGLDARLESNHVRLRCVLDI